MKFTSVKWRVLEFNIFFNNNLYKLIIWSNSDVWLTMTLKCSLKINWHKKRQAPSMNLLKKLWNFLVGAYFASHTAKTHNKIQGFTKITSACTRWLQKQPIEVFLKNLRPATLLKKGLCHRCFPGNFAKF